MKVFGFLCLFLLIGTAAFVYFGYSSKGLNRGVGSIESNVVTLMVKSRKLKESVGADEDDDAGDRVHLDDYRPIDPVPRSETSIRPGPIQHDAPLMPYIPEPSPPPILQPKRGVPPLIQP